MSNLIKTWWLPTLALLLAVATPFLPDFWAFKIGTVIVYLLAVRSLQFLIGTSGQISLGHSAFMALGAYIGGALVSHGLPGFWSHPVAALVCALLGLAFAWPAVRLAGPYLALATFALAVALPQLLKHPSLEALTGGVSGLSLDPAPMPAFLGGGNADQWSLLQCVLWGFASYLALQRLIEGPAGLAWFGLRDHPVAATAAGVNVQRWKATALALSAAMAGLAGSLNTGLTHFVSPDNYGVFLSLFLLVGVSIAGTSSSLGVLAGALFLVFVPDLAEKINKDATGFIYGAIMLACVFFAPALAALRRQMRMRRS